MSICRNLVVLASCFYFVAGKDSSSVPRRSRCPTPSQSNPGTWTTYHDIQRLSWCDSPMLLDFAVYNPLEDPKTHITIRATTSVANTDKLDTTLSVEPEYKKVTLQLLSLVDNPGNSVENHGEHVESAAKLVQTFWQADSNSNMNSIFATAGGTAVAVYAGSMIQKSITTSVIAKKFINYIQDKNVNGLVLLQYCGANSDHMFGIVADTSLDSLPKVQRVVRRWSDGICERDGNISDWVDEVIYVKTEPGPRQPARVNATSDVIHPSFAAKFQQEFQANGSALLSKLLRVILAHLLLPSARFCQPTSPSTTQAQHFARVLLSVNMHVALLEICPTLLLNPTLTALAQHILCFRETFAPK